MQLAYPGFLYLIGLVGIIATATGASILAFNQLEIADRLYKVYIAKQHARIPALAVDEIVEGETTLTRDYGYDEFWEFINDADTISDLGLPVDSGAQITEVGYSGRSIDDDRIYVGGSTDLVHDELYIVDETGEKHEKVTSSQNIRAAISNMVIRRSRGVQDRVVKVAWLILAAGFLLQLASFLLRYFVVW